MTVRDVCRALTRHPIRRLVFEWNWKNALFTAIVRGALFFATNLVDGLPAAAQAFLVDAAFRVPLSGMTAAVTQSLALAQPRWAALVVIVGVVPAAGHVIEFSAHWMAGTPQLRAGVIASVAFTAGSALFNLYSMRRGVFLVGATARPFREDLRLLPALLLDFVLAPARVAAGRLKP